MDDYYTREKEVEEAWEEGELSCLHADVLKQYLRERGKYNKDALVDSVETLLSKKRKREEEKEVCEGC
jgi:hypothetical protein